jgi:hypothetical protein
LGHLHPTGPPSPRLAPPQNELRDHPCSADGGQTGLACPGTGLPGGPFGPGSAHLLRRRDRATLPRPASTGFASVAIPVSSECRSRHPRNVCSARVVRVGLDRSKRGENAPECARLPVLLTVSSQPVFLDIRGSRGLARRACEGCEPEIARSVDHAPMVTGGEAKWVGL